MWVYLSVALRMVKFNVVNAEQTDRATINFRIDSLDCCGERARFMVKVTSADKGVGNITPATAATRTSHRTFRQSDKNFTGTENGIDVCLPGQFHDRNCITVT